jgi:chromosome segregation ATPase
VWEWLKKNWLHVLSFGLTFVIGLLVGSISKRSADKHLAKLQDSNRRLGEQLAELQATVGQLRQSNGQYKQQLAILESAIADARRTSELAREDIANSDDAVGRLEQANRELERFISEYAAELDYLEGRDDRG